MADRTSINSKLKDLQETEIQNRRNNIGYILLILVLVLNLLDLITLDASAYQDFANFAFNFRGNDLLMHENPNMVAADIVTFIFVVASVCTSLFLLVNEWTGAMYMIDETKKLFNRPLSKTQRFTELMKLLYRNLSYLYYFLTTLVLFLGMFNPIFDSIILVIELFKQSESFL